MLRRLLGRGRRRSLHKRREDRGRSIWSPCLWCPRGFSRSCDRRYLCLDESQCWQLGAWRGNFSQPSLEGYLDSLMKGSGQPPESTVMLPSRVNKLADISSAVAVCVTAGGQGTEGTGKLWCRVGVVDQAIGHHISTKRLIMHLKPQAPVRDIILETKTNGY